MTENKVSQPIAKAESHSGLVVPTQREQGQPHIVTSANFINNIKKTELTMQNRLNTFEAMVNDDAVYTGLHLTNIHTIKSLSQGRTISPSGKGKGKVAADFIHYCLNNMTYGSWLQACRDMVTATKCGWSDLNIVTEVRTYGKYKGSRVLRKLSPRDQSSVYGWLWNDNLTEWEGFVQKPKLVQNPRQARSTRFASSLLNSSLEVKKDYTRIGANQLLHSSINGTMRNPEGDSPLMHCYDPFVEKQLIQSYEMTAISKDLVGLAMLRVPSELIQAANDDPNSDAAKEYKALQQNMADFHAGKSSFILLTSDHDPNSKIFDYDFKLVGIDGGSGGKAYQTSQVIDQKRKAIYNCFGAQAALLGQDGGGSYALSSSLTSMHGSYVEDYRDQYADVINTQLIPRLLAINNIYLDAEDMPKFIPANPDELSLDEAFKAIQRGVSVGGMTNEALKDIYERAGLPTKGVEDLDLSQEESKAGEGMKTAAEGTAKKVKGGDKSSANTENGSVAKQLKIATQKGTDRLIDSATDVCINEDQLNSKGRFK